MSVTNTTRASKQPATTITSSLSSLSGKRKYLDEHEVAERLGLSVQFVRKQRYERRPPPLLQVRQPGPLPDRGGRAV